MKYIKKISAIILFILYFLASISIGKLVFVGLNQAEMSRAFINQGFALIPHSLNLLAAILVGYAVWKTYYKND